MKKEVNRPIKIKTNSVTMPAWTFIAHSFVMMMVGDLLCKNHIARKLVEHFKEGEDGQSVDREHEEEDI